jgi:hypothetical protein
MPWQDWFDVAFVRHLVRHVSGTIVAILFFALTAWIVKMVMPVGPIRDRIEQVEGIVILALVAILAIQLLIPLIKQVWNMLKGGWNGTQVLAI